jgi:hydroxymethylbilane synthase
MPIGAYARIEGERVHIEGIVISLDGSREVRASATGSISEPAAAGVQVAEELLARGADAILAEAQQVSGDKGQS